MLRNRSYVKVTGKGSVVKVVKEHYLRDDLGCGIKACEACRDLGDGQQPPRLEPLVSGHILVLDTNIILHHVLCYAYPHMLSRLHA